MPRGGVPPILSGADNPAWTGNAATKKAVHKRLNRQRGRASTHLCVDCGGPAHAWSYKEPIGYSVVLEDYDPRCHKCHKAYDRRLLVASYWKAKECVCETQH